MRCICRLNTSMQTKRERLQETGDESRKDNWRKDQESRKEQWVGRDQKRPGQKARWQTETDTEGRERLIHRRSATERDTDGDSKRDKKDGKRPNKERARDIRCWLYPFCNIAVNDSCSGRSIKWMLVHFERQQSHSAIISRILPLSRAPSLHHDGTRDVRPLSAHQPAIQGSVTASLKNYKLNWAAYRQNTDGHQVHNSIKSSTRWLQISSAFLTGDVQGWQSQRIASSCNVKLV